MSREGRYIVFCLICAVPFLGLAGCAGLPGALEIADDEKSEIISLFMDVVDRQDRCQCCLDADADITLQSMFLSGAISGFLEAMSPSYLKFVGINPLGQPLVIFTTDGRDFQYVEVPEAKAYEGSVGSKAFTKHMPAGFDPQNLFYWLIGRLQPGSLDILAVARSEEDDAYWLTLSHGRASNKALVLFDPKGKVLLRHIFLDREGGVLVDIRYDEYTPGECPLPGRITVVPRQNSGRLTLSLSWRNNGVFDVEDFEVKLPAGFKKVFVQ